MQALEPIAIIGMAGRFPGASDLDEFWENLVAGRDCISELTDEAILESGESPERLAHPGYVRRRPVISDVESFDTTAFGMTPREAEIRDPQHRLLLEYSHAVLEHGGYDPATYSGRIGVYAGTNTNRYRIDHVEDSDVTQNVGWTTMEIANASDYLTTFISYKLGLRGPSMTIQTACSTSLVAVHMACSALRLGECDMAIAGSASLEMPLNRGYQYLEGDFIAPDGFPKPFDASANGTNFGNGVGTVLLKRLSDALADRDTVYAVIRGSAINNDGDRKAGFTAPSPMGQTACIVEALTKSGTAPETISYVEAHGTGTALGDPIELAALTEAFHQVAGKKLPAQSCGVGSVKSNVGHLSQAAGVSSLIKAVLSLVNEQIPPSIHFSEPNPKLELGRTPFYVNSELRPWPRVAGRPRRAGVSSFGIGGTNAHLILEEAPERPARCGPSKPELIVWSAAEDAAESALRDRLAAHFATADERSFADAAHTLRVGRSARRVRGAVVAHNAAEAAELLRDGGRVIRPDGVKRGLTLLFPGQGAQHPGMARWLYETEPLFRQGCDRAFAELEPLLDRDLKSLWLSDAQADELAETALAQPLLYVLSYTWAHCLMRWGVRPDRLLGHSVGELAAAAVSGVFGFTEGLQAVAARATLMQGMPRGSMLAVAAPHEAVLPYVGGEVSLAALNGPRQCVLAGPEAAVAEVAERLRDTRIASRLLHTSHAFHSAMMATAAEDFEKVLGTLTLNEPKIPVVSCATGAEITSEQATSPAFWARQLVDPVDFAHAAATVLGHGPSFLVETGPGHTLSALLTSHPEVRSGASAVLPTMPSPDADEGAEHRDLEEALGRLWVAGVPVDFTRREKDTDHSRVAVPGYPYQRKRHWIERPDLPAAQHTDTASPPAPSAVAEAALGSSAEPAAAAGDEEAAVQVPAHDETSWSLGAVDWVRRTSGRGPVSLPEVGGETAVALLPASRPDAVLLRTALQRAGYRTVRAHAAVPGTAAATDGFDPLSEDEWEQLLRSAEESRAPAVVAYGAMLDAPDTVTLASLDQQLDQGFFGVLACARAVARAQRRARQPVTLVVLVRHAVDVSGADRLNPASAMIAGLTRTIEQEYPDVRCVMLDVSGETGVEALGEQLARLDEPLVALRGNSSWTPVLKPLSRTSAPGRLRLRQRGVYLVTGGLGGIGLVVANALADTGFQPRIALLGRSGMPAADTPRGRRIAAAVHEMEDAGAEVIVVRGDASAPQSLLAAVEEVERTFGTVHGVVHSAGLPGGGLIERRSREDADAVIGVKVRGALAIEEVFRSRPELDFLALFSSQAGVAGLYGSADYAAANAFLDAHAQQHGRGSRWTVAVDWPGWAEVGMAADSDVSLTLLTGGEDARKGASEESVDSLEFRRTLVPGRDWELDEHQFDDQPVAPGTALLELVVTAALALELHPAGTVLELRESVFLAPAAAFGPTEFAVVFSPMAGMHRFRVQTRPAGSEGPWTLNANGVLAVPETATATVRPDLGELREGLESAEHLGFGSWITFGPRWDSVGPVQGTATERVAELRLPEEFHGDLEHHPMHAAILDVATSLLPFFSQDVRYLPFLYRRLTFFGPLPAHVLVHARLGDGEKGVRVMDLDLYDLESGELRLSVGSFTLREVKGDQFVGRLADASRTVAAGQAPGKAAPSAPAARTADAAPDRPGLLTPVHGAEVFLELVNGSYPQAVIVDAPGARMRARGLDWADSVPSAPRPAPAPQVAPRHSALPPAAAAAPKAAAVPMTPPTRTAVSGGSDDVMASLMELWSEALGHTRIDYDEDFFDVGGNSLAAVQLTARIKERFGIELSAGSMFEFNTIRLLAAEIVRVGA
ncbi:SDR family NAD(P)-dependent oxidoreductase [Streptomyces sp. NPDC007856]|uniref:SDR family NAD(P)-dependent oxidoreductase n=1 Tax=Streptomyces sp. NPDC007856 TaxID=3364781 RepID=UPI00367F9BEA